METGLGSLLIHIADVDGDRDEDIVVGSALLTRTYLFRNDGNAAFQVDCDFNCQFVEPSWGSVIDLVDVDLDGDLDAVSDYEGVARWIENADGLQVQSDIHFVGEGELDGAWVFDDFDSDGDVDAWGVNQRTLYESNAAALRSDLNGDGVVSVSDFLVFSSNLRHGRRKSQRNATLISTRTAPLTSLTLKSSLPTSGRALSNNVGLHSKVPPRTAVALFHMASRAGRPTAAFTGWRSILGRCGRTRADFIGTLIPMSL